MSQYCAVDEKLNEANDYVGEDLYGGHLQESYICKVYREASANQPFEYMTSRCDPGLLVHTTTKTLNQMRLHNQLTLAHHGAMLFIDAIDPVGTLNPMVYDRIGKVFEESIPMESYLKGKMLSEAALIMSYDSKHDVLAPADFPDKASCENPQLDAQIGMARILKEMKMLFTVLPTDKLTRMKDKKLVILTEACSLRKNEVSALKKYVADGGSLYMSGTTDPALAKELLGLEFKGYTKENQTYIAPSEKGKEIFGGEFSRKYPLSVVKKQMLTANPLNQDVLATIVLPYTDPADTSVFASIHSNPPGIMTDYPAVVRAKYGKGTVLWLSASVENTQAAAPSDVVKRMIASLAQPSVIKSDAPFCVEMTLFRDEENHRYLLHMVNVQESREILPVYDFSVSIHLPDLLGKAYTLPDQSELPADMQDGVLTLHVDKLDIASHILLPMA